ncbi:MAG: hypothetical protein CTY29_02360 [Methylobacter sp.]|nr:MAG: hypothetical protein CTY29_02360 [Methylobacter sp.]
MKGIIFTEFLNFVSELYGEDTVDDMLEESALASGGAYTSVGSYPHEEFHSLCLALEHQTQTPVRRILHDFGIRLSVTFVQKYAAFFCRCSHYFDFIESIEDYIHKEVRKLYPDAELPSFKICERTTERLVVEYTSPRRLCALAEGLFEGTALYFDKKVLVQSETCRSEDKTVRFTIDLI